MPRVQFWSLLSQLSAVLDHHCQRQFAGAPISGLLKTSTAAHAWYRDHPRKDHIVYLLNYLLPSPENSVFCWGRKEMYVNVKISSYYINIAEFFFCFWLHVPHCRKTPESEAMWLISIRHMPGWPLFMFTKERSILLLCSSVFHHHCVINGR